MLTEITGNLLHADLPAIAHGCNRQGMMGAGIARAFRATYPEMYREYRALCQADRFPLGSFFAWDTGEQVIYNLATQNRGGPDASIGAIRAAVGRALADCETRGIAQLGVPRIGAGIGGLAWDEVRAALEELASESPVELVVVTLPSR